MNSSNISIVIPTRNRPELLAETIISALQQTLLPEEIIVGDDSDDHRQNQAIISQAAERYGFRFLRHLTVPTGNQAANVERLYSAAEYKWICLIHDDDLLMPNALDTLLQAAHNYRESHRNFPVLVYGQQRIINQCGIDDAVASEHLNCFYYRTLVQRQELAGNSTLAAIVQQSPNDGYLVNRDAAIKAGYNSDPSVGSACDFAFAVRLSALGSFCYVPQAVAKYRLSEHSVTRGQGKATDDTALAMYSLIKQEIVGDLLVEPLALRALRHSVSFALNQACREKNCKLPGKFFSRPNIWRLGQLCGFGGGGYDYVVFR